MAVILFRAYPAQPSVAGCFSVVLNIGRTTPDPFPSREFESNRTADIVAAFNAYKAEATATGKPMALSIMVKAGRKPNGFEQACGRGFIGVNV